MKYVELSIHRTKRDEIRQKWNKANTQLHLSSNSTSNWRDQTTSDARFHHYTFENHVKPDHPTRQLHKQTNKGLHLTLLPVISLSRGTVASPVLTRILQTAPLRKWKDIRHSSNWLYFDVIQCYSLVHSCANGTEYLRNLQETPFATLLQSRIVHASE